MGNATLTGTLFAEMVRSGAALLSLNRQIVNELNVFPIPDGDTGDNMFMTINSGASMIKTNENRSLSKTASLAACAARAGSSRILFASSWRARSHAFVAEPSAGGGGR